MSSVLIISAVVLFAALLYAGLGYAAWVAGAAIGMAAWWASGVEFVGAFQFISFILVALAVLFGAPPLRRIVISTPAMRAVGRILPRVGDTERIALEAGTVWWDGDLFSGAPDWNKLLKFQAKGLTKAEQAFLDGPVEELCRMVDDWQIIQHREIPDEIWDYMKRERFFGMVIPESYGGRGFSAIAHSAVVTKIASRSLAVAVTVMVPNSLGPAELLYHYGTEKQKDRYLPRLARGEEIPCFALTEPAAGSDAASVRSQGVICQGDWEGEKTLGIRLSFEKRYITLAPIATLIGLAFQLRDPDGLLGDKKDIGITCALISHKTAGLVVGDRHDPLGIPFQNGTVFGKDVFIPLSAVIGGEAGMGQGWRMLMECLSVGRSISLPALSVGASELSVRTVGAYATLREQFNLPIGRLEGVTEVLGRIGGKTYLMDAARRLTCGAVDAGERPSVLSAVAKRYLTQSMREVVDDAFDIQAGAAIIRGPRNVMGRAYQGVPIAITVEGANILIRSLMIFGQGAIRCHPFVHDEMEAAVAGDAARFDTAFFGHIGFVARNGMRSFVLALTRAALAQIPANVSKEEAVEYRRLTRLSAAFALVSDVTMGTLGGALKRKEALSGRLADAISWLYLGSAALKRYHDEGRPTWAGPYRAWALAYACHEIEKALLEVIQNLPNRPAAWGLRLMAFPFGASYRPPADRLSLKVGAGLLNDGEARRALSADIHIPNPDEPGLGRMEAALAAVMAAAEDRKSVIAAVRRGDLAKASEDALADAALKAGIVDAQAHARLKAAAEARDDIIQVDSFDPQVYMKQR